MRKIRFWRRRSSSLAVTRDWLTGADIASAGLNLSGRKIVRLDLGVPISVGAVGASAGSVRDRSNKGERVGTWRISADLGQWSVIGRPQPEARVLQTSEIRSRRLDRIHFEPDRAKKDPGPQAGPGLRSKRSGLGGHNRVVCTAAGATEGGRVSNARAR